MYYTEDSILPENMAPGIITVAPFGRSGCPGTPTSPLPGRSRSRRQWIATTLAPPSCTSTCAIPQPGRGGLRLRTRLLRKVPDPCFVRWFCSGSVLLLVWLAPADVIRCSFADETLASTCMFSTAITFFHSLNNRFPLPPARGILR